MPVSVKLQNDKEPPASKRQFSEFADGPYEQAENIMPSLDRKGGIMTPPPNEDRAAAWDQIMEIAKAHALILNAYGGVATLVHPDTQEQEGLSEKIFYAHGMGEHPKTIAMRKAGYYDLSQAAKGGS